MSIVTRTAKGSALTIAEGDGNLTHLRDGLTLMVPGQTGYGMKVDSLGTPTFGWKDLLGELTPKGGTNSPTQGLLRGTGTVRSWFYANNEQWDCLFHIPHDYVPGSDLFFHIHWGHNGTGISGTMLHTIAFTYAKGHTQEVFPAEVGATINLASLNLTNSPRYCHRIDEIQISAASPNANQIASANLEVDGILMVTGTATTIPTITGGTPNKPYLLYADIHYQSTGVGTKNRAPNFWAA